jgi:solute carrier family 13 (sodium-dependent dicarboxylate transporter), member 2/3/5
VTPASHKEGAHPAQRLGLLGGAVLFLLMVFVPPPAGLSIEGWRTAAVALLMAVWWMTEAVAIPVTALLPLVLFPALGVLSASDAASPYAHELIFLFMGGFFLAAAMEHWGLHRRIALGILGAVGTSPERLVLGFMLATAFLSMWISNTATAAMMFPIGMAVAALFAPAAVRAAGEAEGPPVRNPLGVCLMLAIAYGASIGGVATLIGTPPNAVLAGAADELLGVQIGFLQWMAVGVPTVAVMLPLTWLLLVKVLHPPGGLRGDAAEVLARERAALGPRTTGETRVAVVFVLTALGWLLREPKDFGAFVVPGLQTFMPELRDSTIAMAGAMALFLLPAGPPRGPEAPRFLLEWPKARKIAWGVLVLFGGGLSLARAMDRSGLASYIGGSVEGLGNVPPILIVGVVALMFVFLTEVTSNTATATMAMPVMAGAALGMGLPPLLLMTTAAMVSSMAFMLPVATPPNAIVFGSEHLTIPIMARAGFILNLLSVAVVTAVATFLVPLVLANLT